MRPILPSIFNSSTRREKLFKKVHRVFKTTWKVQKDTACLFALFKHSLPFPVSYFLFVKTSTTEETPALLRWSDYCTVSRVDVGVSFDCHLSGNHIKSCRHQCHCLDLLPEVNHRSRKQFYDGSLRRNGFHDHFHVQMVFFFLALFSSRLPLFFHLWEYVFRFSSFWIIFSTLPFNAVIFVCNFHHIFFRSVPIQVKSVFSSPSFAVVSSSAFGDAFSCGVLVLAIWKCFVWRHLLFCWHVRAVFDIILLNGRFAINAMSWQSNLDAFLVMNVSVWADLCYHIRTCCLIL